MTVDKFGEQIEDEQEKDQVELKDEFDYSDYDESDTQQVVRFKQKIYLLREASGKAAKEYRNASLACIKLGPEGKPSELRNLASVEPLLVARCLWEVVNGDLDNPKLKAVTVETVEAFPSRLQKRLFERIKEISDISEESEEKAQFVEALNRADSPVTIVDLRKFINELPDDDDEFKQLKDWIKPSPEEKAKNVPSDTTVG